MIPKAAIEKAKESGWKPQYARTETAYYYRKDKSLGGPIACRMALDPSFWQCLGKALGWESTYKTVGGDFRTIGQEDYREYAHRFYDIILAGGGTEAFWNELL